MCCVVADFRPPASVLQPLTNIPHAHVLANIFFVRKDMYVAFCSQDRRRRPCLVPCAVNANFFSKESYQFEVLNKVYLNFFLHRWVVNRETNLMMLINP